MVLKSAPFVRRAFFTKGFCRKLKCFINGQKKARSFERAFDFKSLAMSYFHMASCHTIIGAKRFHFRVRDGIGWFTLAMFTKQTGLVGVIQPSCAGLKFLTSGLSPSPASWKSVSSFSFSVGYQLVVCCHPNALGVIWSSLTGN